MDRWTIETELGITKTGRRLVYVVLCERTRNGARIVRTWTEERRR
jgi:hypothetical protein